MEVAELKVANTLERLGVPFTAAGRFDPDVDLVSCTSQCFQTLVFKYQKTPKTPESPIITNLLCEKPACGRLTSFVSLTIWSCLAVVNAAYDTFNQSRQTSFTRAYACVQEVIRM